MCRIVDAVAYFLFVFALLCFCIFDCYADPLVLDSLVGTLILDNVTIKVTSDANIYISGIHVDGTGKLKTDAGDGADIRLVGDLFDCSYRVSPIDKVVQLTLITNNGHCPPSGLYSHKSGYVPDYTEAFNEALTTHHLECCKFGEAAQVTRDSGDVGFYNEEIVKGDLTKYELRFNSDIKIDLFTTGGDLPKYIRLSYDALHRLPSCVAEWSEDAHVADTCAPPSESRPIQYLYRSIRKDSAEGELDRRNAALGCCLELNPYEFDMQMAKTQIETSGSHQYKHQYHIFTTADPMIQDKGPYRFGPYRLLYESYVMKSTCIDCVEDDVSYWFFESLYIYKDGA